MSIDTLISIGGIRLLRETGCHRVCLVECSDASDVPVIADVADSPVLNHGGEIAGAGHADTDIGGKPIPKYNGRSPMEWRILVSRGARQERTAMEDEFAAPSLRCSDWFRRPT